MDSALHLRVAELHNERAPKIPGKFAKNHQTGRKCREIHKIQQKLAQGMLLASPFCLVRIPNIKGCVSGLTKIPVLRHDKFAWIKIHPTNAVSFGC